MATGAALTVAGVLLTVFSIYAWAFEPGHRIGVLVSRLTSKRISANPLARACSLMLWIGIMLAGRWIGERPTLPDFRPAIGRVKNRSTKAAKPGRRGAKASAHFLACSGRAEAGSSRICCRAGVRTCS